MMNTEDNVLYVGVINLCVRDNGRNVHGNNLSLFHDNVDDHHVHDHVHGHGDDVHPNETKQNKKRKNYSSLRIAETSYHTSTKQSG